MRRIGIITLGLSVAVAGALLPAATYAAESAHFMNTPATGTPLSPNLAVQFDLKMHLPQGKGLARQLLDAGVNRDDAAAAARLAAGHLGDGTGGCDVKVSISRNMEAKNFTLERALITSPTAQTVIERRNGELTIASTSPAQIFPKLS